MRNVYVIDRGLQTWIELDCLERDFIIELIKGSCMGVTGCMAAIQVLYGGGEIPSLSAFNRKARIRD